MAVKPKKFCASVGAGTGTHAKSRVVSLLFAMETGLVMHLYLWSVTAIEGASMPLAKSEKTGFTFISFHALAWH